jgi:hypothetical protein
VKGLNWTIILYNITEAREQLQEIESRVAHGEKMNEFEFQIMLEHAYHHLNFAWNIRHAPTKKYANLTNEDFNLWSKYPKELWQACSSDKEVRNQERRIKRYLQKQAEKNGKTSK